VPFTPQSLKDEVLERSSRLALVLFGASWSADCVAFAPTFAELSLSHGREHMAYGEVDLAVWPALAEKFKVC